MKNLMSRDEYLQSANEGFIRDTLKKGWEAIKSAFRVGMAKVRDFIAIFDGSGKVLPVVSPQAIIDKFANDSAIKVYSSKAISDTVVDAGGTGCPEKAPLDDSDEVYNEGPDGDEYADWLENGDYKDTLEYKNFASIPNIIKEHFNCTDDRAKKIFEKMFLNESWEGIVKNRVSYVDKADLSVVPAIDYDEYERIISEMVEERVKYGGKAVIDSDGEELELARNIMIFGAPGIGKSTIPNTVIRKYNETVAQNDPAKMISLININCALLEEGGLVMPTMPQDSDIVRNLQKFQKTFPQANDYLEGLDDEETEKIAKTMAGAHLMVKDAPKSWLPSYQRTGDDNINAMLDAYANGSVYKDKNGYTTKTGSGGIIIFDEFLRANEGVFSQLMNFFLDRTLYDWELGSKWMIMACSNRPCDDGEVAEKWGSWNDGPAAKDRMESIYQLIPDPEQWMRFARSKNADELLLEFIFDKESMKGDEYPRWHSMVRNGSGESKQVMPIGPRRWMTAFTALRKYEKKNGYKDISQMTIPEIETVLKGKFDTGFVAEITSWLRDHLDKVDLDAIMKDPKSVYLPQKFTTDQAAAKVLVQNLLKEFKSRFKDNPEDCTDDQLANVIAWLGINYRGDMYTAISFMEEIIKDVFKNGSDTCITRFHKVFWMLNAAYPPQSLDKDIVKAETRQKYPWPEGSKNEIIKLMREFFPWRISGDEIKYYDKLDLDDEDTKKEVDVHTMDNEK